MIFLAPVITKKVITRIHLILTLVHLYMLFGNMESSELRSVMNCWLLTSYEYSLFVVSALL